MNLVRCKIYDKSDWFKSKPINFHVNIFENQPEIIRKLFDAINDNKQNKNVKKNEEHEYQFQYLVSQLDLFGKLCKVSDIYIH